MLCDYISSWSRVAKSEIKPRHRTGEQLSLLFNILIYSQCKKSIGALTVFVLFIRIRLACAEDVPRAIAQRFCMFWKVEDKVGEIRRVDDSLLDLKVVEGNEGAERITNDGEDGQRRLMLEYSVV